MCDKQAFISCVAGNYYVSLSYEDNKSIPKLAEIKSAVGLDMGLENLLIRSDKIVYENKKFLQNKEAKLIKLQKAVSKKKKGSNNRAKAIKKLAIAHHRVVLARDDYLHKITNEITNDYDFIAIENLNVKGLIRNKYLSKSIANVSRHKLKSMLAHKAELKGKTLMQIDKVFPSSRICSNCGVNTGRKALNIRAFTCPNCNTYHHRDLNASINIRNYALGMLDDRSRVKIEKSGVGITRSYACGDSSCGTSKYFAVFAS